MLNDTIMKQAKKITIIMLMLAGALPADAQKTEQTRSVFFTGGVGITTSSPFIKYGNSSPSFASLFEAGYQHNRNSIRLQYLFQVRDFLSISFGEGGGGNPLNSSDTYTAIYGRRVVDHAQLTIDLHGGAGVERYTDKERKKYAGSAHFVAPVYANLQFTFSKKKRQDAELWFGVRGGTCISGQRSFGMLLFTTSLNIPR
jgi:hypothetical protein